MINFYTKNKLSITALALVCLLTLFLQPIFGMKNDEEDKKIKGINPINALPPSVKKKKPLKNNKESYLLLEKDFSKEKDINFAGLYKHIHYIFKNENILLESLYPLLPETLQQPIQKFEHLEFLGDSVLGLIIRERILDLFPNEERGMHCKLYEFLTCNKTLAEVYIHNLEIEPYLPYPGKRESEHCNVVEAIIGAIYKDGAEKGLTHSKKFVMKILNDHVLKKKWEELLKTQKMTFDIDKNEFEPSMLKTPSILPKLQESIKELIQENNIKEMNTKSLLGMILEKTFVDQPQYIFCLGRNEDKIPGFISNVVGAQIGHTIRGFGLTKNEAEQDAARRAINFLAQEKLIPQSGSENQTQNYTKCINEYSLAQKLKLSSKKINCDPYFTFQVKIEDKIIGEGTALSIKKAKENAACNAFHYLTENQKVEFIKLENNKTYQSILYEWRVQEKISDYQLTEKDTQPLLPKIKFQIMLGEDMMSEGVGSSTEEARENACSAMFDQLLEIQEKTSKEKLNRKLSAKCVKNTLPSSLVKCKKEDKKETINNFKEEISNISNKKSPEIKRIIIETKPNKNINEPMRRVITINKKNVNNNAIIEEKK